MLVTRISDALWLEKAKRLKREPSALRFGLREEDFRRSDVAFPDT